jgi:hypothetical protein
VFVLAATNTDPQGIADPLPTEVAPASPSAATDLDDFSSWRASAAWIGREAPHPLGDTVVGSMTDDDLRSDRYKINDIELQLNVVTFPPAGKKSVDRSDGAGSADDESELDQVFGDFDVELLDAELLELLVDGIARKDAN